MSNYIILLYVCTCIVNDRSIGFNSQIVVGCVFEGESYQNGQKWIPASRPCDQCICYEGVVSCRTFARCKKTCSYGVYSDGECCSECTGMSRADN